MDFSYFPGEGPVMAVVLNHRKHIKIILKLMNIDDSSSFIRQKENVVLLDIGVEQRIELLDKLSEDLFINGLNDDSQPTEYGYCIEELIDIINGGELWGGDRDGDSDGD